MIRTSLFLPEVLHQRLVILSRQKGKSFSDVARELFQKALAQDEKAQLTKMYKGLRTLQGIGDPGITDASTTINETLYGEKGAWRGSDK